MRTFLAGLLLPCLAAAGGCGTLGNVFGPRPNAHLYGGVEFDCVALCGAWEGCLPKKFGADTPARRLAAQLLVTAMITTDLPLSLAGDTVTLPGVLLTPGPHLWGDDSPPPQEPRGPVPPVASGYNSPAAANPLPLAAGKAGP